MRDAPMAKLNSTVNEGDQIGIVGSTGSSKAPHVHYEIQRFINGKWVKVNPVVGGQDKVTPSDDVDLIDPQKLINARDGLIPSSDGNSNNNTDNNSNTNESNTETRGENTVKSAWQDLLKSIREYREARDSLRESRRNE